MLFHITIGETDAWGHGYGTEAARLMLWLAFERIGLHRVGLSVFAFNERAIRSYEKAGFRVEGRLREAIARDGRYWDEIQMGVLRDEWLVARAAETGRVGQRDRHAEDRRAMASTGPARGAARAEVREIIGRKGHAVDNARDAHGAPGAGVRGR